MIDKREIVWFIAEKKNRYQNFTNTRVFFNLLPKTQKLSETTLIRRILFYMAPTVLSHYSFIISMWRVATLLSSKVYH